MKNILTIMLFLISITIFAQNTFYGRIVNLDNKPLYGADIILNDGNDVATDKDGNFEIILANNSEVIVSYLGYQSVRLVLMSEFNIIRLELQEETLHEIVISASREKQKRRDVPGAISVITEAEIEDTKAFGIEQIVNQVSGVYMATSKASSNEQHFMSVRSPISTKSLFLYLEDGLPIRPTAVFNHNALLEMNSLSFNRVEVLKGPASSIYGSESIGGSFNYITKNPSSGFHGSLGYQINDMGFKRYELEVSLHNKKKFGFYLGTQYSLRENGPIEHSDYEKFAVTLKTVLDFNKSIKWVNVFDIVDYRSDMSGALSESDYIGGNYESDQTFTERDALSFRFRSTLDKSWNQKNKTSFNAIYRDNKMDQIPSYRIRQFRDRGQLTGNGLGEINSNKFNSIVGLIQHKIDFNSNNASLIFGTSLDYSPQDYVAESIDVIVDPSTGKNISYSDNDGNYILNYDASIFNYAGYFQYEVSPIQDFKITAALRYDKFVYDYNNRIDGDGGAKDTKSRYDNITPKLGLNYNFTNDIGLYINYSNGFTPPQTSTLYRNKFVGVGGEVFELEPSVYDNYEIGTYFISGHKIKMDVAFYVLDGKNTLITLRDENDEFYNSNAGKTRSYGVEYGVTYFPVENISISHNGSYAKHRYINFYEGGVDYSDTDVETAPSLLGITLINYKPEFIKNFSITAEHELVGEYNTSFEGQIKNDDGTKSTATYAGHSILNFRASYGFKNFEIWAHAFNVFDELYAVRTSYNIYRKENSYSLGNPRAFHAGIRYKF
jgi:iron complex outermembrane receptor protein